MHVTTIGLDIAKNVFQVHGIDSAEKVVVRKQLRRGQVMAFFEALAPCLVGMEACATAHHWARVVPIWPNWGAPAPHPLACSKGCIPFPPGQHAADARKAPALFESGRPVLIAPPSPRPDIGTNVMIAWNCSTEQARTIAFAMPILKRANRVIVLTVEGGAAVPGPTGQQLCHYLQLSRVPAKPLIVALDGRLTGEAVLAHAKALGCDLLIKGAYTQSRLRQFIFGGTTRYILSNAGLPVFMAH